MRHDSHDGVNMTAHCELSDEIERFSDDDDRANGGTDEEDECGWWHDAEAELRELCATSPARTHSAWRAFVAQELVREQREVPTDAPRHTCRARGSVRRRRG